jgi:hypothetical protein
MKELPLIGRIQERIGIGRPGARRHRSGPAPEERADGGPETPDPVLGEQADWLFDLIRRLGSEFLELAGQEQLAPASASAETQAEARLRSLLLGYKLALTAWRRRDGEDGREVPKLVRRRMIREIRHRGPRHPGDARRPDHDSGENARLQELRQAFLDPADADVAAAVIRFEAGLPGPLTPFYGDLAPLFGGPCSSGELAPRYGKLILHLYERIQTKLDARDRSSRPGAARFAGAGR